jgi:hypothetical protein
MVKNLGALRRRLAAVALAAALCGAGAGWAAEPATDPALLELNAASRAAYAVGREALLLMEETIIVVESTDLVLIRGESEERVPFTPPLYHALKAVAHLPLGIYGTLVPITSGALPFDDWRPRLTELRARAVAAAERLDGAGFDEVQLRRQRALIDAAVAFIDETFEEDRISGYKLRQFARDIAPLTLANAADAARVQVDGLHAAFERIRDGLHPRAVETLHVMVLGPKAPREGNLQYEYFVAALGGGAAAERQVIYAESIFDKERALDLLETVLIDRRIGEDFYRDEARMARDLLADGAAVRLMEIFGRLGAEEAAR